MFLISSLWHPTQSLEQPFNYTGCTNRDTMKQSSLTTKTSLVQLRKHSRKLSQAIFFAHPLHEARFVYSKLLWKTTQNDWNMLLSTLFELCSYTQGKCGIVKELEINQSSHWQVIWSKRFLPKSLPIWFMIGKQHYTFFGTPFMKKDMGPCLLKPTHDRACLLFQLCCSLMKCQQFTVSTTDTQMEKNEHNLTILGVGFNLVVY